MWVLKTRAVTGNLVPFNGEHVAYKILADAFKDALVLASVFGEDIYVVDKWDMEVAYVPSA